MFESLLKIAATMRRIENVATRLEKMALEIDARLDRAERLLGNVSSCKQKDAGPVLVPEPQRGRELGHGYDVFGNRVD